MERSNFIHAFGPTLAMLAEVVPQLAFADTTAAESPSSGTASLDDVQIVNTAEELLSAVNDVGVRHVVIRSHMNVTSSNSSSSTSRFREVLLRLPKSTKHIQGDCVEDHPTAQPRLPRQCVLNVRQSFLEAAEQSAVRLVNLYVTSSPPFAPATPPDSTATAIAPAPEDSSVQVQSKADQARYISYLEIYKSDVWMYNVTLEGTSEASSEGVNVLGASSTTGRAYAEGCLFTGFRSAAGAAWSIHASRARSDDLPTAASFSDCAFTNNIALRAGGAVFVDRSSALRLERCTFSGNAAPDGADVAADDEEPAVFSSPPIMVHSEGVSSMAASQDVLSQPLAAASNFDFLNRNDDIDAAIAEEFSVLYIPQPLPTSEAPAPAPAPALSPLPTPAATPPAAPVPAAAPAPVTPAAAAAPVQAPAPAPTSVISPSPAAGEAAGQAKGAAGLLRQAPGQELIDGAGQSNGSSLPETTLVATLAAAAVLAVFLVALLLFVSRHKARRRRMHEESVEVSQDRMAGAAITSGMDIVSSGATCVAGDYHILYVLPRIQEEATGDLAATSSLIGGRSDSGSA